MCYVEKLCDNGLGNMLLLNSVLILDYVRFYTFTIFVKGKKKTRNLEILKSGFYFMILTIKLSSKRYGSNYIFWDDTK